MISKNNSVKTSNSKIHRHENTYDKYSDNDQFVYDENSSSKSFLKQDSELYNEEDAAIRGKSVRVKRIDSDWGIYINEIEVLILKWSRFSSKEREYLQSTDGFLFLVAGAKQGWNSVSEFKRQLKDKLGIQ